MQSPFVEIVEIIEEVPVPMPEIEVSMPSTSKKRKASPKPKPQAKKAKLDDISAPIEKVLPRKKLEMLFNGRRSSLRSSSRESSVEPIINAGTSKLSTRSPSNASSESIPTELRKSGRQSVLSLTPASSGKDSESQKQTVKKCVEKPQSQSSQEDVPLASVIKRKTKRVKKLPTPEPEAEESENEEEKLAAPLRKKRATKKESPPKSKSRIESASSSNDESDDDNVDTAIRNSELVTNSAAAFVSNSRQRPSSILIRNDYLKSPPPDVVKRGRKPKKATEVGTAFDKLKTVITKKKSDDKSYVVPPKVQKRERLRTSAFKGNESGVSSNVKNELISYEPSSPPSPPPLLHDTHASRDISHNSDSSNEPLVTKRRKPKKSPTSKRKKDPPAKAEPEQILRISLDEALESSQEDLVPYNEIAEAVKVMEPPKKSGRTTLTAIKEFEKKKEELLLKLRKLRHFDCGNCKRKVTKHRWKEHWYAHGGMAWLEGYEKAIDINDWYDTLRRLINTVKIYGAAVMFCNKCNEEKKSALGHLSHIYICGETEETIESRKLQCELCSERFLPVNATYHKTKCSALKAAVKAPPSSESEDEQESATPDAFDLSGRVKRKSVKK